MESKSDKHTRVSTLNVRPSVAGIIADSDGNLDEKKAVAALSQTREQNKHMWIGCFVLIGVVFILIAANIGTSVAVARLTRQLNVDPVTGMATIPGSDNVVMKTSTALYKEEDVSLHSVSIEILSSMKTFELADGDLSFDVKGYARMSNETVLLVEGGTLTFDIIGLKNVTGDQLQSLLSSSEEDMNSIDLHGRKLVHQYGVGSYQCVCPPCGCGNICKDDNCVACNSYSYEDNIANGVPNVAQTCCMWGKWAASACKCAGQNHQKTPCYPISEGGPMGANRCGNHAMGTLRYSCPEHLPYCNEGFHWCRSEIAHRDQQESSTYDYYPHCHE